MCTADGDTPTKWQPEVVLRYRQNFGCVNMMTLFRERGRVYFIITMRIEWGSILDAYTCGGETNSETTQFYTGGAQATAVPLQNCENHYFMWCF